MFCRKKKYKKFKCSRLLEGDGMESRLPFKIFSTLPITRKCPLILKLISFSDPMMMALGAMVTMAGAYMAIVMQETAAANAFAIAAASGKKKKK